MMNVMCVTMETSVKNVSEERLKKCGENGAKIRNNKSPYLKKTASDPLSSEPMFHMQIPEGFVWNI